MLKNALSALYLLKESMDFNQTCTNISSENAKKKKKKKYEILVTSPYFQGHRSKNVEKCLACTLPPEWMDGF